MIRRKPALQAALLALVAVLWQPMLLPAQTPGPARDAITVFAIFDLLAPDMPGERSWPNLYGAGLRVSVVPGQFKVGLDAFDYFSVSGYYSLLPEQPPHTANDTGEPVSAVLYGGELGVHLLLEPAFGLVDPMLAVGAGTLALETADGDRMTTGFFSPGVSLRFPIGSRVQLQADGRYNFVRAAGSFAGAEISNLPQLRAGLGIGF